jgi:hypothetical protein
MSIYLGVNIDHIATIRQARGTNYPSPVAGALLCEKSGADSITLHLREDRRHIQDEDVVVLHFYIILIAQHLAYLIYLLPTSVELCFLIFYLCCYAQNQIATDIDNKPLAIKIM